jgi:hypothetical protein
MVGRFWCKLRNCRSDSSTRICTNRLTPLITTRASTFLTVFKPSPWPFLISRGICFNRNRVMCKKIRLKCASQILKKSRDCDLNPPPRKQITFNYLNDVCLLRAPHTLLRHYFFVFKLISGTVGKGCEDKETLISLVKQTEELRKKVVNRLIIS